MLVSGIYRLAGIAIITLVILLGVLAGVQMLSTTPLWSPTGAAWIQAIGSIGAIIGTWYATKIQLEHGTKTRKADRLEDQIANAQIALDLATDTSRALRNILRKFQAAHNQSQRVIIGIDRLEALLLALQNFGARNIPPNIYAEVLCLQRETSYSITAVDQQNRMIEVDPERLKKATGRCAAVFCSQNRISQILIKARRESGERDFEIGPTNGLEDSEW